mgnify:CR=1 FL=1
MMNKEKKLKYLDIVFENCETCRLEPNMIYGCVLDGLHKNIGINCFQYENGEIFEQTACDEFMMVINQKGLQQYSGFDDFKGKILEERIKSKDITHVDLIYEDDTNDYITMNWEDDYDEFTNKLQNNMIFRRLYGKKNELFVCDSN